MTVNDKYILGIETSCDDTSIGYISLNKNISKHYTANQLLHASYNGIVPTLAAREHLNNIQKVMEKVLEDISMHDIVGIAVTTGPGLIASLMIGVNYAKMLADILKVDLFPIHHLEGHMFSAFINRSVIYPYIALLVSGGHTQFILAKSFMNYTILSRSIDDALGECFDKIGVMLGLEYPGGPKIEKISDGGDCLRYKFPMPMLDSNDISFSGLKTAVLRLINKEDSYKKNIASTGLNNKLDVRDKRDIAASFQYTIQELLIHKTRKIFLKYHSIENFILVGGVSANQKISNSLKNLCITHNKKYLPTELKYCMDNGSMIARAGLEYFLNKKKLLQNNSISNWCISDLKSKDIKI